MPTKTISGLRDSAASILLTLSFTAYAQAPDASAAASGSSASLPQTGFTAASTLWLLVIIAAIAVALLIFGLSQPSKLRIEYNADSFFQVRKLFFAAGVLGVLAFILVLSIAVYVTLAPPKDGLQIGKEIFDSMVKIIPPIMTLVLGYYFGQQSVVKQDAAAGGGQGSTPIAPPKPPAPAPAPMSGATPGLSPAPIPAVSPSSPSAPSPSTPSGGGAQKT